MFRRNLGEDVGSRCTIGNRKLDVKSGFRSAPPLSSITKPVRAKNGLSSNGVKVFVADELSDSAMSTEVSYEAEVCGVQNNISSHNECERRRNVEAGTSGRTQHWTTTSTSSLPRFPTFHASEQGSWSAMIAYEACMRLCLHSWSMDSVSEASYFLNNECTIMRNAFSLQRFFLQSEEELLGKRPSELVTETCASKSKKTIGKIRLQVCRIKMGLDPPPGCNIASLTVSKEKLEVVRHHVTELNLTLSSGWKAAKKVHVTPQVPLNGSLSRQSLAYVQAAARYLKQVSKAVKNEIVTSHTGPQTYEAVQETYSCSLRLKSSAEEDQIKTQPGSGETFILCVPLCTHIIFNGCSFYFLIGGS